MIFIYDPLESLSDKRHKATDNEIARVNSQRSLERLNRRTDRLLLFWKSQLRKEKMINSIGVDKIQE